jgi:hypothetical protein
MIHFVGGEKGGIGKSVFARLLSQYLIDASLPFVALDADSSHATLTRYYQEFTQAIDLDRFESTDLIMEQALESDRHVLVDLPAQSERFLDRWIEENDVLGLCGEMGVDLVYWYLVDDGGDSAALLNRFANKYGSLLNCAVIKNRGCGSDFSQIDAWFAQLSEEARERIRQVELPALHGPTMLRIDRYSFSYWAAANLKEAHADHLGLMERQRTKVWMKKGYGMIEGVIGDFQGGQ